MLSRMARPAVNYDQFPSKTAIKTQSEKSKFFFNFGPHNAIVFGVANQVYCRLFTLKDGQQTPEAKNAVTLNLSSMIALRSYLKTIVEKMQDGCGHKVILDNKEHILINVKEFETKQGRLLHLCHIRKHYVTKNSLELSAGGTGITVRLEELLRFQEIFPSMMAAGYAFMMSPNVTYENRQLKLHFSQDQQRWIDIDNQIELHQACSTISNPQEAYTEHKRLEQEHHNSLLMEAALQEEMTHNRQKQLMEMVVVGLVLDEIKEKQIAGSGNGDLNDENIRTAMENLSEIDMVSVFCNAGNYLNIPMYQGFELASSVLIPQNHAMLYEKIRKAYEDRSTEEQNMFNAVQKDILETLH